MQVWSWYCSTENKTKQKQMKSGSADIRDAATGALSCFIHKCVILSTTPEAAGQTPCHHPETPRISFMAGSEKVSLPYAFCISSITRGKDLLYWWQGNLENMVPFKGFIRMGFILNINNNKILTPCFTSYCVDFSFSTSFSSIFSPASYC